MNKIHTDMPKTQKKRTQPQESNTWKIESKELKRELVRMVCHTRLPYSQTCNVKQTQQNFEHVNLVLDF